MANNIRNQPQYLQSGDPEQENNPTLYAPGQLGSRVTVAQPGPRSSSTDIEEHRSKTYQCVQVDSTITTGTYRGAVGWWRDKARYLVTTDPTNRRGMVAGVFQTAVNPGYFGYVQTQGPATTKIIDAPTAEPTAAGQFVIPSATAAKADVLGAGSAATYPPLGRSMSARTPASECVVDLDVPETP